jgi:hypothetical protein
MNFKRHKPHFKKSTGDWSTPVDIKIEKEPILDTQKWHSKRKYPCKKLKGEHRFIVFKTTNLDWYRPMKQLVESKCEACGKKKWDISQIPVVSPKERITSSALLSMA